MDEELTYLTRGEVRRLVPIVIDMIRDDLNPVLELRRGVIREVLANENPDKVLAVQNMVGRWFARSMAQQANERNELEKQVVELESNGELTYVYDPTTADFVLRELERTILEQWGDAE
jgi:hypothetical protein